ncbi:hypothetical protein EVAR_59047_1 [Eumeta japonica]|uniref:Uncharacterized protein n=1 Tax=Eumeta variegata TaxID=151549 RepID=A0A4C1YB08_EUMVA|nr:hypothetical protein EVAR_59047_1 [Eumeta japonica]
MTTNKEIFYKLRGLTYDSLKECTPLFKTACTLLHSYVTDYIISSGKKNLNKSCLKNHIPGRRRARSHRWPNPRWWLSDFPSRGDPLRITHGQTRAVVGASVPCRLTAEPKK